MEYILIDHDQIKIIHKSLPLWIDVNTQGCFKLFVK